MILINVNNIIINKFNINIIIDFASFFLKIDLQL